MKTLRLFLVTVLISLVTISMAQTPFDGSDVTVSGDAVTEVSEISSDLPVTTSDTTPEEMNQIWETLQGDFAKPVEAVVEVDTRLRVREYPWGPVLDMLTPGSKVTVTGMKGEFYKIDYNGRTAYVHRNYISIPGLPASQDIPDYPPGCAEGGYIPDPANTTVNTSPSPTETQTNSPLKPNPTVAAAKMGDGTAAGAVAWAEGQLPDGPKNGFNTNNGLSTKNATCWNNYCLAFVSTAWGRTVPEMKAYCAIDSYYNFKKAGKITNDRNPPAGAAIFQDATSRNSWGHIFIATGRTDAKGDPIIITSGWPNYDGIHEITLSKMEQMYSGKYLGWTLP